MKLLMIMFLPLLVQAGFEKIQPEEAYFSEGAAAADINNDGQMDLIYGSTWYAGPDFQKASLIFPPKAFSKTSGYANSFFSFPYDFNRDGWMDVLAWGLPNSPGTIYVNPQVPNGAWTKQVVFPAVGHESPSFQDVNGDGVPDLVCVYEGAFGYATFDPEDPYTRWTWHAVGPNSGAMHGLGIGDVNGDGRIDLLASLGWFEQGADAAWTYHKAAFGRGGAQMYAYDVDGDGDNDVITSLAGHGWGMSWFEQHDGGAFTEHRIMGSKPSDNPFAIAFSQLHAMALADMDGDGLKDIITGKCYFAHNGGDPGAKEPSVMYVFKLTRDDNEVLFVPEEMDGDSGLGRQISIADMNRDGRPDVVSGNKKGAFVFLQDASAGPVVLRARPAARKKVSPKGAHFFEGEALTPMGTPTGHARSQMMSEFGADLWSGDEQLWWTGAKPGDRLAFELNVAKAGRYKVVTVMTKAIDYGIAQFSINGEPLGAPVDFYDTRVIPSGEITLGECKMKAGSNVFTAEITGAHPDAKKGYMLGFDYIECMPVQEKPQANQP
jgi:hypothetical protein